MKLNISNQSSVGDTLHIFVPYCMAIELVFFPNERNYLLNWLKNKTPNKNTYYILYDSISKNATFISVSK